MAIHSPLIDNRLCRPCPLKWRALALVFRTTQTFLLQYFTCVLIERAKTRPVRGPGLQKSASERDWGLGPSHSEIWSLSLRFGAKPNGDS